MSAVEQSLGGPKAAEDGTKVTQFLQRPAFAATLFVLGVFLVYQPVWRGEFIWDDDAHLTAHRCIVGPLGFKEIWTTSEANYFPLVLTTFWVLKQLFGLNPLVFHLTGIALHATCGILLWRLLQRLRVRGALLGAALWTFHPVQVESVAWVSEIINTQSCGFFLLSLWFAIRWLDPLPATASRPSDYALACLCALAAILSKPSTVMLPVVLGLCSWWFRGRLHVRDIVWLAPFFLMALAASGWTIWEQSVRQGATGEDWNQSFSQRVANAGYVIWFYLGKLVWPQNLSFIYPRWTLNGSEPFIYLPSLLAALAGIALWVARKNLRAIFAMAAYYVIMLFPVLGFFNVYFFRYSFVADHFVYLAAIGPLALAGTALAFLTDGLKQNSALPAARVVHVSSFLLVLHLALLSWNHAKDFRNDDALWGATLRTNPNAYLAHNNLGVSLVAAGKAEEALAHYFASLAIAPELAETHFNLGKAFSLLGRTMDAVQYFENAVRLKPGVAEAHLNLANALAVIPTRRSDAIPHYLMALRFNPQLAEAHSNLSLLLGGISGRLDEAIRHGETALRLRPASAEAHFNHANNLARLPERIAEAVEHYETAVRLKPDYLKAHINLGLVLSRLPGRLQDALQRYQLALTLSPNSAVVHNNFAIALVEAGRADEAISHFEQAVLLDPDYIDARNNLTRLKMLRTSPDRP